MADKDFKVKSGLDLGTPLPLTEGGTGQTSANNALNALLPVQTDNSGKVLTTDGSGSTSWVTLPNGYSKGNTASRPGSPSIGDIYSNTQTSAIEVYTSVGWSAIGVIPKTPTIGSATNVGTSRAFNNGAATVAFTPDATGGLAATYTATSSPGGFTGSASSSPVTVSGLQSNTAYTFTVIATNSYGNATATGPTSSITATTVPQAPTIGSPSSNGNTGQISVPFTANATGGSAITGYTVTSSPGSFTATGSSSPLVVTGLTDGTNYTFTVTATNSNGTSLASSASASVAPVTFAATGGTVVTSGGYKYHTFTSNGTFQVTAATKTIEAIVAAGGGGGDGSFGGGGAGGFRYTAPSIGVGSYSVVVGGGGGGSSNGSGSSFNSINSSGGGRGTGTGGSGGGSNYPGTGAAGNVGGYSPVEGYKGGDAPSGTYANIGGGGGGAAGPGVNGDTGGTGFGGSGDGGPGNTSYSTWASATGTGYGGGWCGGGGARGAWGSWARGLGQNGGGNGASNVDGPSSAEPNSGSGGGAYSGSGGSGIVIIRYTV